MATHESLALSDLIDEIKQQTTDHDTLMTHFRAGTMTTYYEQLIKRAVEELMMIPARRVLKDLPMVDDADEAQSAIAEIAMALATLVDKSPDDVHTDLMARVQKFPFQDVQQSTALRKVNRLN